MHHGVLSAAAGCSCNMCFQRQLGAAWEARCLAGSWVLRLPCCCPACMMLCSRAVAAALAVEACQLLLRGPNLCPCEAPFKLRSQCCSSAPFVAPQSVVQQLPAVGKAHLTPDEEAAAAEEAAEDAARRAAWAELNQLREEKGQTSSVYKRAHERFLATWGHKGAELRE